MPRLRPLRAALLRLIAAVVPISIACIVLLAPTHAAAATITNGVCSATVSSISGVSIDPSGDYCILAISNGGGTAASTEWTLPGGLSTVSVMVKGAKGESGTSNNGTGGSGGYGAVATANINVAGLATLSLRAGGQGAGASGGSSGGGRGGGASSLFATTITSNLLLAGGGGGGGAAAAPGTCGGDGGSGGYNGTAAGGAGEAGANTGCSAYGSLSGLGGTGGSTSAAGTGGFGWNGARDPGTGSTTGSAGSSGVGGAGGYSSYGGGGGGNGLWGGGGGGATNDGAGGGGGGGAGSSFAHPTRATSVAYANSYSSSAVVEVTYLNRTTTVSPATLTGQTNTATLGAITVTLAGGTPSGVSVTASSGTGTLSGTTTGTTNGSGQVVFDALVLTGTLGSYTLSFAASGYPTKTVSVTLANPGPASAVTTQITAAPTAIVADGSSTSAITIQLKDVSGNSLTSNGGAVALAVQSGGGTVSSPATCVSACAAGRLAATYTSPTTAGSAVITGTLTPNAGTEADITDSETITLNPGPPTKLRLDASPSTTPNRTTFSPAPVVQLLDANDNVVTTDSTTSVTAAISAGPAGGTLAGTTTATAASGVVTFSNLQTHGAVGDYTIGFSSGSLTPTSFPLSVTPGPATALAIATQPVAAAVAGAELTTQPVIRIEDADQNLVTSSTALVTLAPQTGGFVGPTQASTATAAAVGGIATFSGVVFGGPLNSGRTLTFSSPSLASATSNAIMSTHAGSAYKLVLTTSASSPSPAGAAFATVPVIARQDLGGNLLTAGPQVTVTASIGSAGQYVGLVGATAQRTASGVATFIGLGMYGTSGQTYTVTFDSPGLVAATQSVVASTGAASGLSLTATGAQQPSGAVIGSNLTQQPKVQVVDAGNNAIAVPGVVVTASVATGTGTITNNTATTAVTGLATWTTMRLGGTAGSFTLAFSGAGYGSVNSGPFALVKATQTVAFTGPVAQTVGASPVAIAATSTADLPIAFASSTPAVCGVSSAASVTGSTPKTTTGLVSILGGGTCTIAAVQPGDDSYDTATVEQSFAVNRTSQATLVVLAPAAATAGETIQLQSTGGSGSGGVTFAESSDPAGICAVTPGGTVTFTDAGGSCQFTATKAADASYTVATSAPATVAIASGSSGRTQQTVVFTSTPPGIARVGTSYTVTATASSGLAPTIAIAGGSSAICAIAGSPATVTFLTAGVCPLIAEQSGDARFNPASPAAEQTIIVTGGSGTPEQQNQSIVFPQPADMAIGAADAQLAATASSGLPVTFASGTPAVCTVVGGGIVHPVGVGSCAVTATQAGSAAFAPADAVVRHLMIVAGAPGAPFVTAASGSNGAVTVSYIAPGYDGGAPIVGYRLTATPAAGPAISTSACAVSSPCTLSGLENGTAYAITLAAINVAGTGAPGSGGSVIPRNAPSGPGQPQASRTGQSVVLSWSQPTLAPGVTFVRYDIFQREAGASSWGAAIDSVGPISTTSTTIDGLASGIDYEFRVLVVTIPGTAPEDDGEGTVSTARTTVPGAPQTLGVIVTGATSIVVTWAAPHSNGGSPITGYSVALAPNGTCGAVSMDGTTFSATCPASALSPGTQYALAVRAINANGSGEASSTTYTVPGGGGGGGGGGGSGSGSGSGAAPSPTPSPTGGSGKPATGGRPQGGGAASEDNGTTKGVKPPPVPGPPTVRDVPAERQPDGSMLPPGSRVTVSLPRGGSSRGTTRTVVFAVVDRNGTVIRSKVVTVARGAISATAIIRPRLGAGERVVAYTTNASGVSSNAPQGSNLLHRQTTVPHRGPGPRRPFGRPLGGPIIFPGGSATLSPSQRRALNRIAARVIRSGGRVFVTGYARAGGGSAIYLRHLSTMRAHSVAEYLARRGVHAWIRYWGMGPRTSASAEADDRRAVVTWSRAALPPPLLRVAADADDAPLITDLGSGDG